MKKKAFHKFYVILSLLIFCRYNPLVADTDNSPLLFGNPSEALFDEKCRNNFLMEKKEYSLSYNDSLLGPNWVAWHLQASDLGEAGRSNKFIADNALPEDFYRVTATDYKFTVYGFDRGHLCPSADRTANVSENQNTFLMTNMLPQSPDLNRILWVGLEKYERELALAGNELYIFAGGNGTGGEGQRGAFEKIPVATGEKSINVPEVCWKILIVMPEGQNDFERIVSEPENVQIIAVIMPNVQIQRAGESSDSGSNAGCGKNWENYVCSINKIEEITGYDFLALLPEKLQTIYEERVFKK